MKTLFLLVFTTVFTLSSFAQSYDTNLPDCLDRQGNILTGKLSELEAVMKSPTNRPQVYVSGVVTNILPEDHHGNPHQKFIIEIKKDLTLKIVTNLDFGRIPVQVGAKVEVCGEYAVNRWNGLGLVHWTHFDRRNHHPNGFTVIGGMVYGETLTHN